MELDDFKSAWKTLDARLQRDSALQLQLLRDRKLDKARGKLRPLFWGQVAQMGFGLAFIVLASVLWSTRPETPSVIVAGIVMHAYGVLTVVAGGIVLARIRALDYAAPVLDIQKQLARARATYIRSGMIVGLAWWFLWVPLLMVLAGLNGGDLLARTPGFLWSGIGAGVVGLLGTAWFHHWARRPERADFGRKLDASLTGASLRRAQAELAELERFEQA